MHHSVPRNLRAQGGFSVLGVLVMAVAIIIGIMAWTLSGQTSTNVATNAAGTTLSSALILDGDSLKTRYYALSLTGGTPSTILFKPDVDDPLNLLDRAAGLTKPVPPSGAVGHTQAEPYTLGWILNTALRLPGLGTDVSADPTMLVLDVTDSVCLALNQMHHNTTDIPVVSGVSDTSLASGATAANPVSTSGNDLTGQTAMKGWLVGCFRATGVSSGASASPYINVLFVNMAAF